MWPIARAEFEWRLRRRSLALGKRTLVMAIVNVTPDSFSDGSDPTRAVELGLEALAFGADVVDVGGESTRPGAVAIGEAEEQDRVLPVIEGILAGRFDAVLSVDTYHASTVRLSVEAGAEIVNDVSGFLWDERMPETCAELGCGVILMHTRGRPLEWADFPRLEQREVLPLVLGELEMRAGDAIDHRVRRERVVLDPGFGFGKIGSENYGLLSGFSELQKLGFPLLGGVSRKGFLGTSIASLYNGKTPSAKDRLFPTIAAQTALILSGAHIVRVHDVRPALEAAAIADEILAACQD